jgi:hypothetical protein
MPMRTDKHPTRRDSNRRNATDETHTYLLVYFTLESNNPLGWIRH